MNFIKNNRELIVVVLVVASLFVMATGLAYNFRGGNASIYWSK